MKSDIIFIIFFFFIIFKSKNKFYWLVIKIKIWLVSLCHTLIHIIQWNGKKNYNRIDNKTTLLLKKIRN